MSNSTLVITPGDPDGIGPEVTAKALAKLNSSLFQKNKNLDVLIFGSKKPFRRYEKLLPKNVQFFEPPARSSPGYQSGWSIETATQFVMGSPKDRFLVTGPISKERLQQGGYFFNGHTDLLASLTRTPNVTMMLANEFFRVALVTNHCALKEVSARITTKQLLTTFGHATQFGTDFLRLKKTKIAVLGLNPHAGENNILGSEENTTIIPAMKEFQKKNKNAVMSGPHPADSFFAIEGARKPKDQHQVIVAMYHDQGLIPVKLSGFSQSLNITLGLPFVRTSVDHGTAFDIAGNDAADPHSMIYAIQKAIEYQARN
jgi:4-hydroxythreonine-4-phosphate dehydrogenase